MLLTEREYHIHMDSRTPQRVHPLCARLRELRQAAGLSLAQAAYRFDRSAIVIGAYERGDRIPPMTKLDALLSDYGYRLAAVPIGEDPVLTPNDMAAALRKIADQLDKERSETDSPAAGIDTTAEGRDADTVKTEPPVDAAD